MVGSVGDSVLLLYHQLWLRREDGFFSAVSAGMMVGESFLRRKITDCDLGFRYAPVFLASILARRYQVAYCLNFSVLVVLGTFGGG